MLTTNFENDAQKNYRKQSIHALRFISNASETQTRATNKRLTKSHASRQRKQVRKIQEKIDWDETEIEM